jgi:hypothetical protein
MPLVFISNPIATPSRAGIPKNLVAMTVLRILGINDKTKTIATIAKP